MGKVYREFSRQKYNKYKHQFPKMRESEIVSKIIKEWDALNGVAKDHLQKIYEKNKCLTLEDISSSEQLMKSELKKKADQMSAQKSAEAIHKSSTQPVSATKVFPPPSGSKPQSDSDYNRDSKSKDDSKVVESSSPKLIVAKTKKIIKKGTRDYIKFYQLRYNKLHAQHPRWTPKQISSIIKLEWKKEKGSGRTRKTTRLGPRRQGKLLTGYRFYRRYRGFTAQESFRKWRRFPYETKKYWSNAASGETSQVKRDTAKLSHAQDNNFAYLVKKLTTS